MIRRAWRALLRFLASAGLAVALLVFVGIWSALATLVAQGDAASPGVMSWAAAHPLAEPVVRVLGLHNAFTSYVFLGCVLLLGISTATCAWRRTKAALSRSGALRSALRADAASVIERHDLEIPCSADLSESDVLSIASGTLGLYGIRTTGRRALLTAVSSPWSVWGSTVFHWGLVSLMVAVLAGQMLRAEGSMAVAVSETKADRPASYTSVQTGPLHDWDHVARSIRVDAFDPDYKTGGIDRGPVPTVSVLDAAGDVIVSQLVFPNNMLHSGSLAINAPAVGLSVWFATVDAGGAETGRIIQHVDFSQSATGGTVPVRAVTRRDASGKVVMRLFATVPLDRAAGGYGEWVPKKPTARLRVIDAAGKSLVDRIVRPGENVALPGGGTVRLLGVGWYSRLSVVDDPTIPLVYAAMIVAIVGLTMTLLLRQQLVVATYLEGPDGPRLAVRMHLWRNAPTNRGEIEGALIQALGSDRKGSVS